MSINNRVSSRISPEYALLGFLYKAPCHGYELHKRLMDEFGNIWHASQSQTYNILKRLVNQGYVISTQVRQAKHPSRQLLTITETGLARFEHWLHQPTKPSVHAIRVEFVTRLYFSQLYFPENTRQMIQHQIDVVNTGVDKLRENINHLSESKTFNRLALELRLKLLNSVIAWLNECYQSFANQWGNP